MVVFGFLVFPIVLFPYIPGFEQYEDAAVSGTLTLYVLLLPNFAGFFPIIAQFWSIGAEEQFYLFWPLLTKFFKNTYILCLTIIVLQLSTLLYLQHFGKDAIISKLTGILAISRFNCMAIGGIFAAILFNNKKTLLKILMWRGTLMVTLAAFLALYIDRFQHYVYGYTVFGFLFAIMILNIAANPNSLLKLEWRWTAYLGRISYGIYVYHILAIYLVGIAAAQLFEPKIFQIAHVWLLIALTGFLSVGISAFSYKYFETKFLKRKSQFAVVVSRDSTKF